jgi:hypothetical protein
MYVAAMVTECDFSDRRYDVPVQGAMAVARGASGRYCAVMFVGPEILAQHGVTPLTEEQAHARIKLAGDGYADF